MYGVQKVSGTHTSTLGFYVTMLGWCSVLNNWCSCLKSSTSTCCSDASIVSVQQRCAVRARSKEGAAHPLSLSKKELLDGDSGAKIPAPKDTTIGTG